MKARDIIFTALVGFLVTWSALSAFALVQALVGFSDTYAELVTKYPTLATNEARQATLQTVMLHEIGKWAIVAAPLGLLALIAKWWGVRERSVCAGARRRLSRQRGRSASLLESSVGFVKCLAVGFSLAKDALCGSSGDGAGLNHPVIKFFGVFSRSSDVGFSSTWSHSYRYRRTTSTACSSCHRRSGPIGAPDNASPLTHPRIPFAASVTVVGVAWSIPFALKVAQLKIEQWCRKRDSNPRPHHYE